MGEDSQISITDQRYFLRMDCTLSRGLLMEYCGAVVSTTLQGSCAGFSQWKGPLDLSLM